MKESPGTRSIAQEIKDKTGFILEHDVATMLEKHGWTIIHNRYYLDDMQSMQREIDLLVYKVDDVEGTLVYTSLIVSCKKSEYKDWIFLTRDTIGTKSNLDTSPFTYWSNSDEVNHQLKDKKFSDLPYCDLKILKHLNSFFEYSKTVFAFREYDNSNKNHKLANDTGIYGSIITLIKSQGYELDSLPLRIKDKICYYNLNLLTVADVKLFIEVECSGDNIKEREISQINYVNRFLVNRREHNSRIVFTKFSNLEQIICDFDLLHKANCEIIKTSVSEFYDSTIKSDYQALKLITKRHSKALSRDIRWAIHNEWPNSGLEDFDFGFNHDKGIWEIESDGSEEFIDFLNNHIKARDIAEKWLKKHLRSEKDFQFVDDNLPF